MFMILRFFFEMYKCLFFKYFSRIILYCLGTHPSIDVGSAGWIIPTKARTWQIPSSIICDNSVGLVDGFPQGRDTILAYASSFFCWDNLLSHGRSKDWVRLSDKFPSPE